jgi:hypothetical protein
MNAPELILPPGEAAAMAEDQTRRVKASLTRLGYALDTQDDFALRRMLIIQVAQAPNEVAFKQAVCMFMDSVPLLGTDESASSVLNKVFADLRENDPLYPNLPRDAAKPVVG